MKTNVFVPATSAWVKWPSAFWKLQRGSRRLLWRGFTQREPTRQPAQCLDGEGHRRRLRVGVGDGTVPVPLRRRLATAPPDGAGRNFDGASVSRLAAGGETTVTVTAAGSAHVAGLPVAVTVAVALPAVAKAVRRGRAGGGRAIGELPDERRGGIVGDRRAERGGDAGDRRRRRRDHRRRDQPGMALKLEGAAVAHRRAVAVAVGDARAAGGVGGR